MRKTKPKEAGYTMIRQPYRITMARCNLTVIEKRILTLIISKLQDDIWRRQKGAPVEQLSLFAASGEHVVVRFELGELVSDKNHAIYKKALQNLRAVDVEIKLPKTVSKKTGKPSEITILTGLISDASIDKYSRNVTVYLNKYTACELLEISHGLTSFAKEIMMQTDSAYTQKIYEILSHWKDLDVFSVSVEKFKELLSIENKYPDITNLIRNVITPAERELKEIGDIFFELGSTKVAGKIVAFNFIIKHRESLRIDEEKMMLLREEVNNLLRRHFGFKQEHFEAIKPIISGSSNLEKMLNKLLDLNRAIKAGGSDIKNVPRYVVASLLSEFSGSPGSC